MNLTDILAQAGGLQAVARDLGLSEAQAATGAEALLPAILGGMEKQAQGQPNGLDGLGGLLGQLGGGGLLDQVLRPQRTDPAPGNDVLGQIFGSKDVSCTVADDAATRTGLDASVLRKMLPLLPLLAMLVTGYLARQQQAGGAHASPGGGGLGDLIGGLGGMLGRGRAGPGGVPAGQSPGATGGLGGLGALFDLNGDGNPLDDILRMAGKRRP